MISRELTPLPTCEETLTKCLSDPHWRLFSGSLYKIIIKDETEDGSFVIPFSPNAAQRRFIENLWYRNIILKARQLGFSTLIAIVWLDHALFNANQRCGIVAQDLDTAKEIFRDKVKFGYENLPEPIRDRFPLKTETADELLFAHNNSSIKVATSMRGGTIHRLHISEFGKICAKYPDKANEVITGSIPAVPLSGITVIESTAEGRDGEFFNMVQVAEQHRASKKILTNRDYRLHFYAWWNEPTYRMPAHTVTVTQKDHDYFEEVIQIVKRDLNLDITIDMDQRAWYVATRESDFSGRAEKMWQEYPSFPAEAFQVSTEGHYYAKDMVALRQRNGICEVQALDVPVNTFWDIGNSDGCAIWFHQESNGQDRFISYYEAHGEDLRHYVSKLREKGYVFGTHFLPHDADHKRLGDFNKSTREMLQDLMPGERFAIVPRITELSTGIHQTRKHLKSAYFDKSECDLGIKRLEGYKKRFSKADNRYIDQPDKSNGCTEGADALRQWAQAKELNMLNSYGSAMNSDYNEAAAPDWRL